MIGRRRKAAAAVLGALKVPAPPCFGYSNCSRTKPFKGREGGTGVEARYVLLYAWGGLYIPAQTKP